MKAVIFCLVVFLGSVNFTMSQSTALSPHLHEITSLMEGSFSSAVQSAHDTDYYDIRLTMTRIWRDRTDGIWLYVEQAMATTVEKPYRQRFYRLTQISDSVTESRVFTVADPLRFTGAGKNPALLAGLTTDSLEWRTGCSIYLRKTGPKRYEGRTEGNSCRSNLRGAMYATSEAVITEKGMVSWDQGFDSAGIQVWGAEKGGYEFLRIKE